MGLLARKPKPAPAADDLDGAIEAVRNRIEGLKALDRRLLERQLELEDQGVTTTSPPADARHQAAKALLDDVPIATVPAARDPADELKAIMEQRSIIPIAIRLAGERWSELDRERQLGRLADAMPTWRAIVWARSKALCELQAAIGREQRFLLDHQAQAGPPEMPAAVPPNVVLFVEREGAKLLNAATEAEVCTIKEIERWRLTP
jgi:hypothetical protein